MRGESTLLCLRLYVANLETFFEVLSYGLYRRQDGWDGRGALNPWSPQDGGWNRLLLPICALIGK